MRGFSDAGFMPHGHCYLWDPGLVGLMVGSDLLIALAYFSIPVTLGVYYLRRGRTHYDWVLVLFAVFIMACGMTHLMDVYTLWVPAYWEQGVIKAATAAVSVLTAALLWPLLPKALAVPSPALLRETNARLEREIAEHRAAEQRFRLLVESMPNALVIVDQGGRITEINSQTTEWFGYTREELVGQSVDLLVPERLRGRHGGYRDGFTRDPSLRPMGTGRELYGLRRDGSEFPVDISLSPIRTERGLEVIAAVRDVTDRQRAEAEMRESERRFRLLVESMPNALVIVDADGRITEINSQTSNWFGYAREELIGQPVEMLVPERLRGRHGGYRDGFVQNPSLRPMGTGRELYGLCRDGSEFPVDISLSPIRSERGLEVIAAIMDVTDRRGAEQALRESEERYRELLETLPIGVLIHRHHVPQYANRAFAQVLGFPSGEAFLEAARTREPGFYIPEDERDRRREDSRRRMAGEPMPTPIQWRVNTEDGRTVWLQSWHHVLNWGGERVMESLHVDITERHRAETVLRESEERFRRVFEESPLAMVLVDESLRFRRANASFCAMLGYAKEEMETMSAEDVTLPEDFDEERPAVERLFRGEVPSIRYEKRYRTRDGGIRYAELTRSLIADSTGGEMTGIAMISDITERKNAEAEIRTANTALASVNKELESFAYSVSHDLRAPLRAMSGFSHALLEDYGDRLDEAGQDFLRRIDHAVGRMRQLIDDLLTLSRINRGEMNTAEVDLSAIANEVARELREQDPGREVEIRIENGLQGEGDPRLLRVALQNLMSNAWKFTQKTERPRIEVGAEPNGDGAAFFVRDNGVGFDMTYANKLFTPFQRLHTEAEFPGTGIGLAIVQRVVNRHGGQIWAESHPGETTVFRFTL